MNIRIFAVICKRIPQAKLNKINVEKATQKLKMKKKSLFDIWDHFPQFCRNTNTAKTQTRAVLLKFWVKQKRNFPHIYDSLKTDSCLKNTISLVETTTKGRKFHVTLKAHHAYYTKRK